MVKHIVMFKLKETASNNQIHKRYTRRTEYQSFRKMGYLP